MEIKKKTIRNFLWLLLILAIGLFVFSRKDKSASTSATLVGSNSFLDNKKNRNEIGKESKIEDSSQNENSEAGAEAEKPNWIKMAGLVQKSPACIKASSNHKELQLTPDEIFQIYRNHRSFSKSILLDPFRFCIGVGDEFDIKDIEPRGKIKIVGLEIVPINKVSLIPVAKLKIAGNLGISSWVPLAMDFFQSFDFSPIKESYRLGLLVVFDFVEKKDFDWNVAGTRRPPLISGVRYLNSKNLDSFSKDASLVDLRSEQEFSSGSINGAINLPYLIKNQDKNNLTPNPLNIQANAWKYSGLPIDPAKPIILFGQDEYDPRPWAAFITLNMLRYPNIGWIREGYSSVSNQPAKTIAAKDYPFPKERILDAKSLLSSANNQSQFVYVGLVELEKNQFPEIIKIPYYEAGSSGQSLNKDSGENLKKMGDVFSFEKFLSNKSEKIVLTDYDDASNRALKAALWLQSEGYKQVYIFPNGLRNLLALRLAVPEKVNCVVLGSLSSCK